MEMITRLFGLSRDLRVCLSDGIVGREERVDMNGNFENGFFAD